MLPILKRPAAFFAAALCLGCFALVLSSRAEAQRGADYEMQETPPTTPGSGFPGLFDSHLAEQGRFVLEIPTLTADYGVTDRLTIGTSALPLLFMQLGAPPSLYLKTRYRLFSSEKIVSAATLYGGYATNRFGTGKSNDDAFLFGMTSTSSWYVTERKLATLFLGYFKFASRSVEKDGIEYMQSSVSTLLLGGSYQIWLNKWFGLTGTALASVQSKIEVDSSTLSVSARIGNGDVTSGDGLLRVLAEFRLGSWILSPGFVYLPNVLDTFVPVMTAGVKL
jgi:hypothetical protein